MSEIEKNENMETEFDSMDKETHLKITDLENMDALEEAFTEKVENKVMVIDEIKEDHQYKKIEEKEKCGEEKQDNDYKNRNNDENEHDFNATNHSEDIDDDYLDTDDNSIDLGFSIDTTPTGNRECLDEVPIFNRSTKDILQQHSSPKKPKMNYDENNSFMFSGNLCFNCDGDDHKLRDCKLPRNIKKINRAFQLKNGIVNRYHIEEKYPENNINQVGCINAELRMALGIKKNQIPSFIYKMRTLKYPPGWLEEAKIKPSGIVLFGLEGKSIPNTIEDDDELEVKYDINKIISFPGFNVHPGKGYYDDYKNQKAPPFSLEDSKENFIKTLNYKKGEPGYKKKKMKVGENFELKSNAGILINTININHQASTLDSSTGASLLSDTDESSLNEIINKKLNDESVQELTIDNLSETNLSTSTNFKDMTTNDKENANNISLEKKLENSKISQNKNDKKSLLDSFVGTPILKFSQYDKLPCGESFKQGVSEIIHFENPPKFTGSYDNMKNLLYKVRVTVNQINEMCKKNEDN